MSDKKILENLAHKGREALKFLETDTALAIFRDTLEIDENYLDGWVGLGQAYYEAGKLKESEEAFKKAIHLAVKDFGKKWKKKKLAWQTDKNKPILRLAHGLGLLEFRRNNIKKAKGNISEGCQAQDAINISTTGGPGDERRTERACVFKTT